MPPEEAQYTAFAKILHWLAAGLLVLQFAIGWIMPSIRRGMQPGLAMHVHISTGIVVLGLIVVRFLWRLGHAVPPEPELPRWQRNASAAVHWLLYLLVLVTTLTGWLYASARGWSLTFFWLVPLPALVAQGSSTGSAIGELHQSIVWVLLAVIAVHVLAALTHAFVYRDRVMQRMLIG